MDMLWAMAKDPMTQAVAMATLFVTGMILGMLL